MEENVYNVLELLSARYHTFSKGWKKVADFVLSSPQQASRMSATELAQRAGVSESTVARFAHNLGYQGYRGMVRALQSSLQNQLTTVERLMVLDGLSCEEIERLSFKTDTANLRVTEQLNSPVLVEAVVELLDGARRVYLAGTRSSGPLISFVNYYLGYMMDNLRVVHFDGADLYTQIMGCREDDVMLAISFPRYSSLTINLMRHFKARGGRLVVITDHPASPAGLLSDYSLIARCYMNSFVDSFVAPLALINLIIVRLGLKRKELLETNFRQLEEDWKRNHVYCAKGADSND